jgi:hypothetical protein
MKKKLIWLVFLGLTIQTFAQVRPEVLPEIEVLGINYKYISAINENEPSILIKELHKKGGKFDLTNSDTFSDAYNDYYYTFKIPEGKILASYDSKGLFIKTVERFKNIRLPIEVRKTIMMEYPDWNLDENFYYINYHPKKGVNKKYKLILSKNGERKRVLINADGNFL